MFREIRTHERITEEDRHKMEEERRRNQNYLKIKPETDMTVKEAQDFWLGVFNQVAEEGI